MNDDQELAILAEIELEGYNAALVGDGLTQVPYKRGTLEFGAWRAGWASGKVFPNRKSSNTLFPGHRNVHGEFDYRGSTSGHFSLLHHAGNLVEWSNNVMERVQYIVSDKPANEQAIRLRHIVFLGDRGADYEAKRASLRADYYAKLAPLDADYEAKRASLRADYKARASLRADYEAKCASLRADYYAKRASLRADYYAKLAPLDAKIIGYIKPLIDDFAWNGKELVFKRLNVDLR